MCCVRGIKAGDFARGGGRCELLIAQERLNVDYGQDRAHEGAIEAGVAWPLPGCGRTVRVHTPRYKGARNRAPS